MRALLVQVYREEKRPAEAEKLLRETIRETPDDPIPGGALDPGALGSGDRRDRPRRVRQGAASSTKPAARRSRRIARNSPTIQSSFRLSASSPQGWARSTRRSRSPRKSTRWTRPRRSARSCAPRFTPPKGDRTRLRTPTSRRFGEIRGAMISVCSWAGCITRWAISTRRRSRRI